jgi:hypothetical protein
MSLRNKTIKDLLDDCDYYKDIYEMPTYIQSWKIDPKFSYNPNKKCWLLEGKRLTYHPKIRKRTMDGIFDYKTNRPLKHIEPFSNYIKDNTVIIMITIIILLLLYSILYNGKL